MPQVEFGYRLSETTSSVIYLCPFNRSMNGCSLDICWKAGVVVVVVVVEAGA